MDRCQKKTKLARLRGSESTRNRNSTMIAGPTGSRSIRGQTLFSPHNRGQGRRQNAHDILRACGSCCGPKTKRGSSASTYIRMCVHGQMYLFRFVSRCAVRAVHGHTHTRGSESMRIRSVSTKSRCREHMNFTLLKNRIQAGTHRPSTMGRLDQLQTL